MSSTASPCPAVLIHHVACMVLVLSGVSGLASDAAEPSSWSRFRGPDGHGAVAEGTIPDRWDASEYRWQTDLRAEGVGSPVIYRGRVYLVAARPELQQRVVMCVDLGSGKILWEESFPLTRHTLHARNTFASTTPYVDESGIYVAWADPERVSLVALTHEGQVRWNRDLGSWQSQHGFGTSPVILEGKLILSNSQQAEQLKPGERPGTSRMMALDPESGDLLWETPLRTTVVCYGVPALRRSSDGSAQVVGANNGDGLFGLDLETGRMVWSCDVFTARCVSSPLVIGDVVIGTAGSGGGGNHLVAVRPPDAPTSDQTGTAKEVYRMERAAPYVPTPAVVGQRMYMVDDKGIASCVDAATGRVIWSGRIGGNFGASPIVVGEKMLAIDLSGQAHVLAVGDAMESLGEFPLGGPVQATPAFAEGCLVLRVGNQLCCLDCGSR